MKLVSCTRCKVRIEIPEVIDVDNPYCEKCFEITFGKAFMENAEKEAIDLENEED